MKISLGGHVLLPSMRIVCLVLHAIAHLMSESRNLSALVQAKSSEPR